MKKLIYGKIKLIPSHFWLLALFLSIGIFLRTYNFYDWLKFSNDQARDAFISSQAADKEIAWPLVGPYMSYSGDGDHVEENSFHLGPIYYFFKLYQLKYLETMLTSLPIQMYFLEFYQSCFFMLSSEFILK